MLIRRAEIDGYTRERRLADLRLVDGRIAAIGQLEPAPGETVIDAAGGAVLPGLHDHHLHLFALAAARASVFCGPPEVVDEAGLAARLVAAPGAGWLRGIGYHESVAGDIDRVWLDRFGPERPVRVQHRGGRRWILNSRALEILLAGQACWPAELDAARGHLDDGDGWIRTRLAGQFPDLGDVSRELASYGITGVTEMTPANDVAALAFIS
ncbi:MAG TPA: amidohydrolase family protein, partial [Novosphingobium sp.]|nr:amidohydrolase family protein [Novosphingobium sp.]